MSDKFLKYNLFSYIIWIQKGHQDVQEPHGASVIKVKGVGRVSIRNSNLNASKLFSLSREKRIVLFSFLDNTKQLIWDAAEYSFPPIVNILFLFNCKTTIVHIGKQCFFHYYS